MAPGQFNLKLQALDNHCHCVVLVRTDCWKQVALSPHISLMGTNRSRLRITGNQPSKGRVRPQDREQSEGLSGQPRGMKNQARWPERIEDREVSWAC